MDSDTVKIAIGCPALISGAARYAIAYLMWYWALGTLEAPDWVWVLYWVSIPLAAIEFLGAAVVGALE